MVMQANGGFDYRTLAQAIATAIQGPQSPGTRLPQRRYKRQRILAGRGATTAGVLTNLASLSAGDYIYRETALLGFLASGLIIDNPTPYILLHVDSQSQIPANTLGWGIPLDPPIGTLNLTVLSGSNLDSTLTIRVLATEEHFAPGAGSGSSQGSGGGSSGSGAGGVNVAAGNGTVLFASTNVLVPARSGRIDVLIENEDAANSIRVGGSTTSTTVGLLVPAGGTVPLRTQAAIYARGVTANVTASYWEDY